MRLTLLCRIGIFALVSAFCCLPSYASAEARPNVLFLILDDMNNDIDFLEGMPQAQTPNLDHLASHAMLFTHAYCAAPACNPTRAAVLSGVLPSTSGVYDNSDEPTASASLDACTYLPEHFRRNGYWTMWAGKVFHKRPSAQRLDAMWDDSEHHDGGYGPSVRPGNGESAARTWGDSRMWSGWQKWTGPDTDFPDVRNANAVIEQLAQKKDKPFFIACGLYRPHTPYTAPKRFFDLYDRESIPLPPMLENDLDDLPPAAMEFINRQTSHREAFLRVMKAGELRSILHAYLACASFADWNVGRILDALDQGPNADNTIVVLWGDHGFHHGEKERFTKFALWEKTTNMPLLIRLPGQGAGKTLPNPVSQMDLYPTLCELSGLSTPDHVSGKSLVPMFENPDVYLGPALTTFGQNNHALRTRESRYIRYANGDEEFYLHPEDKHEWHNQAGNPQYRSAMDSLAGQLPTINTLPVPGT